VKPLDRAVLIVASVAVCVVLGLGAMAYLDHEFSSVCTGSAGSVCGSSHPIWLSHFEASEKYVYLLDYHRVVSFCIRNQAYSL
jgi:hypothetical protein